MNQELGPLELVDAKHQTARGHAPRDAKSGKHRRRTKIKLQARGARRNSYEQQATALRRGL